MNSHPIQKTLLAPAQPVATAVSKTSSVLIVPFDAVIESVSYTPDADIIGANTNTRKIALVNKGQDGNGAVEIAALQFNAGINGSDFDEKLLTNSVTAVNLNVAAGDALAFASTAVGTGLADSGGLIKIVYSKR